MYLVTVTRAQEIIISSAYTCLRKWQISLKLGICWHSHASTLKETTIKLEVAPGKKSSFIKSQTEYCCSYILKEMILKKK